ncbi:YiaA/YiaB family inner membrane protein [Actinomadura parmotrematis]|uniref:YiaAB two helix domain-containing protein n=1 Tax=Actinomadura parmotrematis TaxID=2864039 RepID=A0ABS7FXQ9_9ACTN|nr:YiaA/YiaB family inner membrane protein [Actinomadura parmotrematis]MBW8485208.1 hypothetical protein [Actinomadura parmotrematis]
MDVLAQLKGTTAYFIQAIISFVAALAALSLGVWFLPAPIWVRAFIGLGMLYLTTSTFTLAKCVRDRQEAAAAPRPPGVPASALPPGAPFAEGAAGSWS